MSHVANMIFLNLLINEIFYSFFSTCTDHLNGTVNIKVYILFAGLGRSVLRKTVPEVLSTARGRRPRAVLKTEGTVFLNTDRPRPANNIFIFFLLFFKS